MGCCTACAVRIKSGEMYQPEALGISEELKEQGYGLMCVGYPLTGARGSPPHVGRHSRVPTGPWLQRATAAHARTQRAQHSKRSMPAAQAPRSTRPCSRCCSALHPRRPPAAADVELETVSEDEVYDLQFGLSFERMALDPTNPNSVERDDFAIEIANMDE